MKLTEAGLCATSATMSMESSSTLYGTTTWYYRGQQQQYGVLQRIPLQLGRATTTTATMDFAHMTTVSSNLVSNLLTKKVIPDGG